MLTLPARGRPPVRNFYGVEGNVTVNVLEAVLPIHRVGHRAGRGGAVGDVSHAK